jgi:hypothetical protein
MQAGERRLEDAAGIGGEALEDTDEETGSTEALTPRQAGDQ